MKRDNFADLSLKFLNNEVFLWGLVIGSKHLASVPAQKFQCQLHAPAAVTSRKEPLYPSDRNQTWPQAVLYAPKDCTE